MSTRKAKKKYKERNERKGLKKGDKENKGK